MIPSDVCYIILFVNPDGNPGKIKMRVLLTRWDVNFHELNALDPADDISQMFTPFRTAEGLPIEANSEEYDSIYFIASTNLLPDERFRYGLPIEAVFYEDLTKPRLVVPVTFSSPPVI